MRREGAPIPEDILKAESSVETGKIELSDFEALLEKAQKVNPSLLEEARARVLEIDPDAFAGTNEDTVPNASSKFVDPISAAAVLGGIAAAITIGKEMHGLYKWLTENTEEDTQESEVS
jgi:hypothetical protein